jgi:hypothetical protein
MLAYSLRITIGVAMALACVGCSDPVVGTWTSKERFACGNGEQNVKLEIHDDHSGDGTFCDCKFSFVADESGDDRYRLDLVFADTCVFEDTKYDCDLKREGKQLDCGKFAENGVGIYDKVEEP